MLRLKELRAKFNMTQKDLAERLNMSQQAIAKWENGTAEPTVKNLRELAIIFGIGVDDLLGNSPVVKSTHLCNYEPKEDEELEIDGFWGNLGIKIKGQKKSRWYPITQGSYHNICGELQGNSKWLYVKTLNNKTLLINKQNIKKFTLLDDACDAVSGDWDLQWDAYEGHSNEYYKCLYDYFDDETENIPENLLKEIENMVSEQNLTDDDIARAVNNLGVIDSDGQEEYVNPNFWTQMQELYEWWDELEDDSVSSIIIDADEGNFFYNPNEVAIIEAPINKLKDDE